MKPRLYNGLVCNVHNTNDHISKVIRQSGVWEPNVTYWIEKLSQEEDLLDYTMVNQCFTIRSLAMWSIEQTYGILLEHQSRNNVHCF